MLTYFNGVLQFGQGFEMLDNRSTSLATDYVKLYKLFRPYLDPMKASHYRLFQRPVDLDTLARDHLPFPSASVTVPAGWVYEDKTTMSSGYVYVSRQVNCSGSEVTVPLSAPTDQPGPNWGLAGGKLHLVYVAGDPTVTWSVDTESITFTFPTADRSVLLSYGDIDGPANEE